MIFNRLYFKKVIILNKNYHFLTKIISDIDAVHLHTNTAPVLNCQVILAEKI